MKTIVDLSILSVDSRFKSWAKILQRVDTDMSNGYAFLGNFIGLDRKHELDVGTYVLVYSEQGSRKNRNVVISLYRVEIDELELIYTKECNLFGWALDCRDDIASILNKRDAPPLTDKELELIEALLALEVDRRNLVLRVATANT